MQSESSFVDKIKFILANISLGLVLSGAICVFYFMSEYRQSINYSIDYAIKSVNSNKAAIVDEIKSRKMMELEQRAKFYLVDEVLGFVEFRDGRDIIFRKGTANVNPFSEVVIKLDSREFSRSVYFEFDDRKIKSKLFAEARTSFFLLALILSGLSYFLSNLYLNKTPEA